MQRQARGKSRVLVYVEQGQDEGAFRPELDPVFVAKAIFGVLDEMATDWVLSRQRAWGVPLTCFKKGTGENVEILGWFHIRDQIKDGRLYARHGARAVGFAFDRGEGRLVTKKPRRWFDEQQGSTPTGGSPGPGEDEPR